MIVGEMAEWHSQVIPEIKKEGHTLATHSYSHPNVSAMPLAAGMLEIQHGIDAVRKVLGEDPAPFFRFPFLASTPADRLAVARKGLTPIGWNNLSLTDSLAPVAGHRKRGILITHDLQESILQALPPFLDQMEKYGYSAAVLVPPRTVRP